MIQGSVVFSGKQHLSKILVVKPEREPKQDEVESLIAGAGKVKEEKVLIIDATEQPTNRPQVDQRKYYSGKNHTLKAEIRIKRNGEIMAISEIIPGSIHDYTLLKEGNPLDLNTRAYVDSGYQGLQTYCNGASL